MKQLYQFLFGGLLYYFIEVAFRYILGHRPPHPIMFFVGGFSFIMIIAIENFLKLNLIAKATLCGAGITLIEFCVGSFFKFVLNDMLWEYSGITLFGVISLKWSLLWCGLSLLVILLYRLFKKINKFLC